MTDVYFDIETIPCQMPGIKEEFAADVQPPAQYKKAESIAEWLKENREAEAEKAWLQTSFDGGMGQCCVIGWAVNDGPATSSEVGNLSASHEAALLGDFFLVLSDLYTPTNRPRLIGHNIIGFDLPFLWKRAMVLGVKPPSWFPRDPKPWGDTVFDTMTAWNGPAARAGGSMDRICRILGIPGKGDMDGSKVWPMVQAGRIAEVAEYCRGDVERTRAMHQRMTFADTKRALLAA